jgi:hypothetical protein
MENLNVFQEIKFDQSIEKYTDRAYVPYEPTQINYSDTIRIPINSGDGLTLPCKSYLYMQGTVTKADGTSEVANYKLTNNFLAYLIDVARYEINGVEISSVRNVGAT